MKNKQPLATLCNRRIVLGVTGGIAAYKSAELIRMLRKVQAQVRVVMTESAQEFITPLTMQALSGNPVHLDLLDTDAEAAMGHIEVARWADYVLIAPASANFIAQMAQGRAYDLLGALCLATEAPLAIAPAMNQGMWSAKSTGENIAVLKKRGVRILGPDSGEQACGETGMGRMSEPEQLAVDLAECFDTRSLDGVRVMISAGGTREAIDAVRYLGNLSSGRSGYALARAAVDAGAHTTLVSAATLEVPERVEVIPVESAADMHKAVFSKLDECDIYIGAAAVSDFRAQKVHKGKLDRKGGETQIALEPNPDIIAEVASAKKRPFVVGFAAEVDDLVKRARDKLSRKKMDMICANLVGEEDVGFDSEFNELHVLWKAGEQKLKKAHKDQLATTLIALIAKRYQQYKGKAAGK